MCNYLVVDWGTSNLRIWHIVDFKISSYLASNDGVSNMRERSFEIVLEQQCNKINISLNELDQVFMIGMVGSNIGWKEVSYLKCPLNKDMLTDNIYPVHSKWNTSIYIIPGLCCDLKDQEDVMRGEETQVIGMLDYTKDNSIIILPGTHSKWVQVENKIVKQFHTCMTGELYHILCNYSLLGRISVEPKESNNSFQEGVLFGNKEGSLEQKLFSVRAKTLLGSLKQEYVFEFLSGLMIGSEIKSMFNRVEKKVFDDIFLVSSSQLASRYTNALKIIGVDHQLIDAEQSLLNGVKHIYETKFK